MERKPAEAPNVWSAGYSRSPSNTDTAQLATVALAAIEGALLLAKVQRSRRRRSSRSARRGAALRAMVAPKKRR